MATSTSDDKRAEFAKLFDLFEMLATRRSRVTATQSVVDDTNGIPIPADLEPVFHSLATVVPPRPVGCPRRNTVAAFGRTTPYADSEEDASDSDLDVDPEEKSLAKFPLGKTYAFTFKMMIHKLYQADEWAQKVRDVLQRSQLEYKPLAEQPILKRNDGPATETTSVAEGRVHFQGNVTVGVQRTAPLTEGRPRSHSSAGKAPHSPRAHEPAQSQGTLHAIKRRCIGRRKSLGGAFIFPGAPLGEGWFYDAAPTAAEVRERVRVETTPTFAPVPRPRYQSLQTGSRRASGSRRIASGALTNTVDAETAGPRITKRRLTQGI